MGTNRSQRGRREFGGVDSSGWDGQPIDYNGGVQPPVGCDPYNGVMTVGQSGNNVGYQSGSYGAMVPPTINGATIFEIVIFGLNNGAGVMDMNGNSEIPSGAGRSLLITFGTYPEVEWGWNPGNGDYTPDVLDVGLENYLESEVGNQIPICINWGTAGGGG